MVIGIDKPSEKKPFTAAIITAGGISSRMKGADKLFIPVNDIPIIVHTMLAFQKAECISAIIISCRDECREKILQLAEEYKITKLSSIAKSGENRVESVLNGIAAAIANEASINKKTHKIDFIAVHDGARPLVSVKKIEDVTKMAYKTGAAILTVPVKDTVKKASGDVVIGTPDRNALFFAQTPQVFNLSLYRRAVNAMAISYFNKNGLINVTDDSMLFESAGFPVACVEGDYSNIKITTQEDLLIAESLIMEAKPHEKYKNAVKDFHEQEIIEANPIPLRIGHGYDVHRFSENRRLVLCGENIPFEMGLLGHSDADAAAHAVMDSLLGALALGDIGKYFPDASPLYKDADSMKLLSQVSELVYKNGYKIGNLDITIIAEKPKLSPHILQMRKNLASACKIHINQISIKATTEEGLGLSGDGIGAHSVCIINLTAGARSAKSPSSEVVGFHNE